MMDESRYHSLADKTIQHIVDLVDDALGDEYDADIQNSVATIETPKGGKYIINKQAPSQQIWLSSPISSATHFAWDEPAQAWVSTKDANIRLHELLGREFGLTF